MTRKLSGWICLMGWLAAIAAASAGHALAWQTISESQVLKVPGLSEPAYMESRVDPTFGTTVTKVTNPGGSLKAGMACGADYCTHRYSSAQAWNADQSLLAIVMGCGGICFLDGRTYSPLFTRKINGHCEWLPNDPESMICVMPKGIAKWMPRTDTLEVVWASSRYGDLKFGPGKRNPSVDGRYIALRATDGTGRTVAFAFDIERKHKHQDIVLSDLNGENGYVSISPSGRYIFATQNLAGDIQQSYVFTIDGKLVQHWPEHHRPGHGDMTIDADGEDVYVGISKSDPDKYHVIKRRLSDGKVTVLAPYGDGNHVSARNVALPGWVFVTYAGTYEEMAEHPEWAPFHGEVIALRIDGSGQVRRFAHTRSAKFDYFSHALGSPSPDGSQVIWASNWGHAGGPVAAYVTKLDWPDGSLAGSAAQ